MAVLHQRLPTSPAELQDKAQMNPTLLVSWWCTLFSTTVIIIRLLGRFVRTERLFREDKVMALAIVPLFARMGLIHVVLIWGTNNTTGLAGLSDIEIYHRMVGSKLVLPSRILYATYIWIAKITVVEFLRRTLGQSWMKSYEVGVRLIYGFLALTYTAVVVATLAECHPFSHYWQVVPDPGPQCRSTVVQLITMGICDALTDVVLIAFPIPIVIMSSLPVKRKVSLILLFLLSTISIAVTIYRVPSTIARNESQQYRSLLASLEILAATGVANAIVIGTFVRDTGVKKAKFRAESIGEESLARQITRTKSIAQHHWGSDEDLIRDIGLSLDPTLQRGPIMTAPKPVPAAQPLIIQPTATSRPRGIDNDWSFVRSSKARRQRRADSVSSKSSTSTDLKLHDLVPQRYTDEPESPGTRRVEPEVGFFDIGGLIDPNPTPSAAMRVSPSNRSSIPGPAEIPSSTPLGPDLLISDVGGLLDSPIPRLSGSLRGSRSNIQETDDKPQLPHEPADYGIRRGHDDLRAYLQTTAAGPSTGATTVDADDTSTDRTREAGARTQQPGAPAPFVGGPDDLEFSDAGGLLK